MMFFLHLLMKRQRTCLSFGDIGVSADWIYSCVLEKRVFTTNDSTNIMRIKMKLTKSVMVVLQGLLALEYTTTWLTHSQTVSNNCLALHY